MSRPIGVLLEVEERLRFERLIADLSSRFINLAPSEVDREIEEAQRRVCEMLGIELSVLWQWSGEDPSIITITHFRTTPDGPPRPTAMDGRKSFPWILERMLRGETLVLFTEQLPPEAATDRESRRRVGLKSSVHIPIAAGGGPVIGVLTFGALRTDAEWPEEIVGRLQLVAQVFSSALERKRADLLLRDSEERLRMAADSAGAGLWSLNLRGESFWVTPKTREIFGFEADEVITFERFQSAVHPDDREFTSRAAEHAARSGADASIEFRIQRPDGTLRWVAARGRRRTVPGQADSVMGVVVDLTAAKLAEERWQTAIQASPSSMIVVDGTATIALVNRAAEELFGYTTTEMVGQSLELLVPERFRTFDHAVTRKEVRRLLESGAGYRRGLRGLCKDGRELALEVELTPMSAPEGPLLLASVVDVTARRQAELEARRARAEIARLSRGAMLGELAAVLAHETNQPLSAILCNAVAADRMVQRADADLGEVHAILHDIISDGQRAGEAILRLRMLLMKEETQFEAVNLNDVVSDVLQLIRFDALTPGTRVGAQLAPDLPDVMGDRMRLQQAILNLLMNASDAMVHLPPGDRQLLLCTEAHDGDRVEVSVIDRGTGIDPAVRERMFESFFTTKAGGLGLGLPISRIIVAAHGGSLTGENNADEGATFRITLPCASRTSRAFASGNSD